ncbi:MAG: PAS domain-containing protein [Solirubrobacterales bacterium]|nr:PAS domain-containing protein [Solirubrobacterales bacterium]
MDIELPPTTPPASPDVPLAKLVEVVPMPIAFLDREYRFVFANEAAARQLNTAKNALEGRTLEEVLPDAWPGLKDLIDTVLTGKPVFNIELDLGDTGDNELQWLTNLYPVREGDEVTAVVGMSVDVTKLREVERALGVRNDLFAMLARVNAAVSSSSSRRELFSEICEIAYRTGNFRYAWVGMPKDGALIGVAKAGDEEGRMRAIEAEGLMVITDPNDPRAQGPTGQAYLTGEVSIVNDYFEAPETEIWRDAAKEVGFCSSAAVPIRQQGEVVAVLSLYAQHKGFFSHDMVEILEEITPSLSLALDRLDLERRRRISEAQLDLRDRALTAATQGISIADMQVDGHPIIYASPALGELFGYSVDELLGQSGEIFVGQDTDGNVVERLRSEIAEGRSCEGEILSYRKNGETFWNRLSISPINDQDGKITHAVAVHTDITEQRKLENQVRQAQKMEAIGQLAGGVAHDFNNALTAIRGSVDLALAEDDMQSAREDLRQIDEAAEHATQLTHQLLALSRQQVLQPQSTDLNRVVAETTGLVTRVIGDHIALRTELAPDLEAALVDRAQLQQVILNLSINARDAMPDGGQITIATSNCELDQIFVENGFVPTAGKYVMIEISDNGAGMDEATQAKIFEPFYTTKSNGTGLGLATVYGIVNQTGGCISVESEPNIGSTFTICLPTTSLEVAPERAELISAGDTIDGTETILHVEDSDMLRPLVRRSLGRHGYNVLSAANAEEALAIAKTLDGKLDLVVTDVMMPGLNGRELADLLLAQYPNLRVLFTSGYPSDIVIREGIAEAEVRFLAKPFVAKDLVALVRSILDEPRVNA